MLHTIGNDEEIKFRTRIVLLLVCSPNTLNLFNPNWPHLSFTVPSTI